jgi:hypothetical protein
MSSYGDSDRSRYTRVDARHEPRVGSRANMVTRLRHRDVENLVERLQQPNAPIGLHKHQSCDHLPYIQPTDREHVECVCASCRDKEEQFFESREVINDKEKQLHKSHKAINDKEKQLHDSREAINDKEKQLHDSREATKDKEKLLDESDKVIKDKEKQLDEFREAIKVLAQKCRALEYERWALEVDQFRTLKLDGDSAEKLYEKLKNKSKEFGEEPNQKAKLLSLHTAFVDIQIERKQYLRAEEVAIKTWEEYKDEDTDDSRLSYRQLCKALRHQGAEKYSDLEELLRETWPARNKKHQSQPLWILENGDELCSVLELKGEFESAYALRMRLWRERKKKQSERHKDTVQTGICASQCKFKERAAFEKGWGPAQKAVAYENAMEIVKEIWELWDPNLPSETDVDILTGGHMLGYLYYCQRAYTEARRVFEVVWKERKALFTQSAEDTMLTGHYLSQTYFQLKDYPKAKPVFEEVWNAMKFMRRKTSEEVVLPAYHLSIDCLKNRSTTGSENKSVSERAKSHLPFETLKAWFEIGWAVFNQKNYEDAACILQEVYNAYRAAPNAELRYEDIFVCGRYLGEAIAKQVNGCSKATTILERVLEGQTQHGTKNELEVLECRHLYGCLLKEFAESQSPSLNESFQKAEEELKSVWQTRYNTNLPRLNRSRMLKAGYCLASALISLRKMSDAQTVLDDVWKFEEGATEENLLESLAFCHSLGISLMDPGRHQMGTKELEMATDLFQRVWDISKGPPRLTGVLEDGYHLGSCRMRQLQYPQAKEVLEEVAKMIADAELRDRGRLPKAVREALAQCDSEIEVQSYWGVPVQSTKEDPVHSTVEDPLCSAKGYHGRSKREGPVHSRRKVAVESTKGQRRGEPKRRGSGKGLFGAILTGATQPQQPEKTYSSRQGLI